MAHRSVGGQDVSRVYDRLLFRAYSPAFVLRDCLHIGSEGERDEIGDGFDSDFEVRSSATGRKSGVEDAARSLAQPRIQNVNSL